MFKVSYFVDTHCHLNSEDYNEDLDEVIERAKSQGLARMLVVAADVPNSRQAVELAEKYASYGIYATVGVHPHEASTIIDGIPEELFLLAQHPRVLAIGESGLDYYYDHSPREIQKQSLLWHIELAEKAKKPLVLHIRDAFDDLFDILKENDKRQYHGVIHCFSGNSYHAKCALELGFYLSFAGLVTYKKNQELRDIVASMPLNRLLCETDAPWLAPKRYRGKRNEPAYVTEVYDMVADVRLTDREELKEALWNNACSLFRWEEL
ncbi:MAG: TatD family hydrolase [Aminobacterium colombiense]|nr:TatD family hydrolase [Aminobacterium colombiense]